MDTGAASFDVDAMVSWDEVDEKMDETGEGGCEYDDDDERLKERDKVGDDIR